MAGTYSQLHYHVIFSTKDRAPTIEASWRERLWQYMGGIVSGEGGIPLRIGGVADHVHMLITLKPKHDLSGVMQKLKAKSSGWVHEQFPHSGLWWQDGFGAFTVSHSGLAEVVKYIDIQESHHRMVTFQEEFRTFLIKHGISYEEKYLW